MLAQCETTVHNQVAIERPWETIEHKPSVLVASRSAADHTILGEIMRAADWRVHDAMTFGEARRYLVQGRVSAIVCDWDLPGGSWRDILSLMAPVPDPPSVVVTAEESDHGRWCEAVNLGAYDVLAKPFDKEEVTRIIGQACDQSRHAV